MSVSLFRYNGCVYDEDSEETLCVPISTEKFFIENWQVAIDKYNLRYIVDGANLNRSNLNKIMQELSILKRWANENLLGRDREYMLERIIRLEKVIPHAFIDEGTILYIF